MIQERAPAVAEGSEPRPRLLVPREAGDAAFRGPDDEALRAQLGAIERTPDIFTDVCPPAYLDALREDRPD